MAHLRGTVQRRSGYFPKFAQVLSVRADLILSSKIKIAVQWHDTLPVRACLDMPGIDLELSTSLDPKCSDACYSPISYSWNVAHTDQQNKN